MSGCSYDSTCPMCGNQMGCYSDGKPYDQASGTCLNCGFQFWTQEGQMTLEEVNELRVEAGLEPLKELVKQIKDGEKLPENTCEYRALTGKE